MSNEIKNEQSNKRIFNNNFKVIFILVILLLCISIGYSYLTSSLQIIGGSGIPKLSWDIHFDNVLEDADNTVIATKPVAISEGGTTIDFDIELKSLSDKYGFDVDIVNGGTIDAMVGNFSIYGLTLEQSKCISYTVTYEDGSEIKQNDLLKAGESKRVHVNVSYYNAGDFEEIFTKLVFSVTYVQADENAID